MTDPIARRLSAYSQQIADEVRAPGAHDVYRTIKLRQQRRTTVVTIASIVAVVLLLGTVVQLRRDRTGPVSVPPSASPSPVVVVPPSPSLSPSPSASASPSLSPSLSPTPRASKSPSQPPPVEAGPARRSYPIVDGSDLHVVALDSVTLHPVGDHYEGSVIVDAYDSGRQPEAYNYVYLTMPAGVSEMGLSSGPLNIGGCGIPSPPESWICGGGAISAAGGYARTTFHLTVAIAPGPSTQTLRSFAVRFEAVDQHNTVLTDVTPGDNKAVVSLVLPPA